MAASMLGVSASSSSQRPRQGRCNSFLCTRAVLQALMTCLLLCFVERTSAVSKLGERDFMHLSADAISAIVANPDPVRSIDFNNPSSHLSKILIPRVPDTENNTVVRQYLVSTLKDLNWHVEEDSFTDSTPYGVKRFTNVIATKDPHASRRVIVAAHFDSKYFSKYPENQVRTGCFLCYLESFTPLAVVPRCNRLSCTVCIHARSC